MASGIKKLAYPQLDVDERLSKAHNHINMNELDSISADTIETIRNAALKDLTNVTIDTFSQKMKSTGLAFIDTPSDGKNYVRSHGSWVLLSDAQAFPNITSTSLSITGSKTASITVNLKTSDINSLSSIVDKLDKLSTTKQNEVVVSGNNGSVRSSGIDINSVVTASKLINDVTNNASTTAAMSAKAGNDIIKKINALTGGIGKPRGVVVNAFVSTGNVTTLVSAPPITSGGSGYTEGSIVRLYTNSSADIIPAIAIVKSVAAGTGAITALEPTLVSGGAYDISDSATYSNIIFYVVPSSKSPTSANVATLQGTGWASSKIPKSTLYSITDPQEGDTAYVLEDENDNNFQAIYNYVINDDLGYWVRTITFASPESNYVLRYTE